MYFVYTSWYIVMAILLVAIIGLIVAFVLMDKKDRIIIQEFVQNSQPQPVVEDENEDKGKLESAENKIN